MIPGIGPDAETVTDKNGAKQSKVPYRADLFPPGAFLAVSRILEEGAKKYGDKNWHPIEANSHLNHALTHIFAYLADDTSDEHAEHAACRIMMFLQRKIWDEESIVDSPPQATKELCDDKYDAY